jgi:hypothetical protein
MRPWLWTLNWGTEEIGCKIIQVIIPDTCLRGLQKTVCVGGGADIISKISPITAKLTATAAVF